MEESGRTNALLKRCARKDGALMRTDISITCPAGHLRAVLQAIRDLEQRAPAEIHLAVTVDAPECTAEEISAILDDIGPRFSFRLTVSREDESLFGSHITEVREAFKRFFGTDNESHAG